MHLWPAFLVSFFLLLSAVGLMLLHRRTWRLARREESDAGELDYRRRQFRRRMQTSGMLGLVAVALCVGQLIGGPPLWMIGFWAGVLLLLCWIGLLALVDVWATKIHFGRMKQAYLVERAKLQAEVHRLEAIRGKGKARDKDHGSKTLD